MLTLKKVKELVEAPSHAKRTPSPKMLFEEGIVLLRREFDQGSHLTVYNSGYVLFSAGKRNTVFHIHDCCGDYAYDAAEGKGDVIEEEYFESCEWHIRALFEGERKMEDNQAKCEDAGRSNVCVSYHALSEDWSEIADRTINMLEKIIENSDSLVTTTQIAKEYGCGAKVFNRLLHLHGIQYLANGQWVLYSEHHGKGYTSSLTFRLQRSDGSEVEKLHTAWTQKGRQFLYHTLKRRGVLPLAEQGD
ncbi:phage antirepressor KilAC domain-containing protein [Faecalibacterium sp. HTF-76H]|uniref:Phage antirepressor KilAC domain-containing protein n=1 Tax=Faecalibacterium taiwanense TaxID=3030638 RepID=A0AB35Y2N5_9FIRM